MGTVLNYLGLAVYVASAVEALMTLLKPKTPITSAQLSTAVMPVITAIEAALNVNIDPVAISDALYDATDIINKYNVSKTVN